MWQAIKNAYRTAQDYGLLLGVIVIVGGALTILVRWAAF
jgi:hypothetical protein